MSTMLVWIMVLSLLGQPVITLAQTSNKMEKNLMSLLKMQHQLPAPEETTNQRPSTRVKQNVNPSVKISNIVQDIANTSQDHPRMSGSQQSTVSDKLSHQVNGDGEKLAQNNHTRSSDKHSTKRYEYMDYLGDHTGKRNQHDSHDALPDSAVTLQSSNKVRTVGQKIEPNGLTDKHRTKRSPLDYLDYLGLHAFKRGGQNNYDYLESDYFHDDGGTGKRDAQNYIDYIDHNIHTSKRNGPNKIVVTRDGKIDDHYMDYIDHDVNKKSEAHYLDYLQASKRDANNYMDYLGSDKRSENNYLDYLHSVKRNVNKYRDNLDDDTGKRNEHHYLDYLQASKRDANNYMDYLDRASSKRSENRYLDDLLNDKRDAIKYMDFLDHDTKKRNEPHYMDYLQASKRYDMNHGDYLDHYIDYLQIQAATAETSTEVPPMDYLNAQKRNERHYMDYLQAKKRNDKLPVDYINVNTGKRESHKNRDYIDSDQPYQRDTRGFMTDFTDYLDNLDTGKGNDDLFGDDDDDINI